MTAGQRGWVGVGMYNRQNTKRKAGCLKNKKIDRFSQTNQGKTEGTQFYTTENDALKDNEAIMNITLI